MNKRHPRLPFLWLVSDARNDSALEEVLVRLPRGSGIIYRHYHLEPDERRTRFETLASIAHSRGHVLVLSGNAWQARRWGADGVYGPPERLQAGPAMLRLVTAHSLREIGQAHRARADAIVLSPVFPTRSHPNAPTLGPVRFLLLGNHARVPVIALGGVDPHRARALGGAGWAAIDGICGEPTPRIPEDS